MPTNAPVPGKFDQDHRVHFDKTAGKWQYEDDETGQEHEWSDAAKAWVPIIDESQWKAQQEAYSIAGVDETTPANAVLAREEKRNKKRKKGDPDFIPNLTATSTIVPPPSAAASSSKPAPQPAAPKKTGVWVTNLPPDAQASTIAAVFSKAGVLLIGDDGEPRVKMYYDDEGNFKGEALVMYFKEGSVDLAVTLLDDTELEMGGGYGNMKVSSADYSQTQGGKGEESKKEKVESAAGENGVKTENGGPPAEKRKKKAPTAEEKLKMTKRIKRMQDKLTWHSDSDSDDAGAPASGAPAPGSNRFNRVVVLKGMFKLEDIEKEPGLLIELKEDVRAEAETFGQVTSVILYDNEEDGVMTVKFKDPVSAQACVQKMNGRFFDGRRIYAGVYGGKERYSKSNPSGLVDQDIEEGKRLDNFAHWLVDGDDGDPDR